MFVRFGAKASILFVLIAICLALNKRDASNDEPRRLPSVAGGGKLPLRGRSSIPSEPPGETTLLLQDEEDPLPQTYTFLGDPRYEKCYTSVLDPQGSCNTCWAFAAQKMVQARNCKWNADKGEGNPLVRLSPINLICKLRGKSRVCDPKPLQDVLEYIKTRGVLKDSYFRDWTSTYGLRLILKRPERDSAWNMAEEMLRQTRDPAWYRDKSAPSSAYSDEVQRSIVVSDISHPTNENCDEIFGGSLVEGLVEKHYLQSLVAAPEVFASSAPHTVLNIRKRLYKGGPVIATIRLSWEFLNFKGSLFNPTAKQTFCRVYKEGDPEDYCDPRRSARWDQEQRDQQVMPAGMSRDDYMDSWYNHFVTLHGWGKSKNDGVPYWVVENSWGDIYTNDPAEENNGAGPRFVRNTSENQDASDGKDTSFVVIAERVAGHGGLEFTSREVYFATARK